MWSAVSLGILPIVGCIGELGLKMYDCYQNGEPVPEMENRSRNGEPGLEMENRFFILGNMKIRCSTPKLGAPYGEFWPKGSPSKLFLYA